MMEQRVVLRVSQIMWAIIGLVLLINIWLAWVQDNRDQFNARRATLAVNDSQTLQAGIDRILRGQGSYDPAMQEAEKDLEHQIARLREKGGYLFYQHAKDGIKDDLESIDGTWSQGKSGLAVFEKHTQNIRNHYEQLDRAEKILVEMRMTLDRVLRSGEMQGDDKDWAYGLSQDVEVFLTHLRKQKELPITEQNLAINAFVDTFTHALQQFSFKDRMVVLTTKRQDDFLSLRQNLREIEEVNMSWAQTESIRKNLIEAEKNWVGSDVPGKVNKLLYDYLVYSGEHWINLALARFLIVVFVILSLIIYRLSYQEMKTDIELEDILLRQDADAVRQLVHEMENLEQGNLAIECQIWEGAITEELSETINRGLKVLRKILREAQYSNAQAHEMLIDYEEIINNFSRVERRYAKSIQEIQEQVRTIIKTISKVASEDSTMSDVLKEATESVHASAKAIDRADKDLHRIEDSFEQIDADTKRMNNQISEVNHCLELVSSVSEQTVILALNAAIQAVLAGESGRGFGIVATEMQELSDQIEDMLKDLTEVLTRLTGTITSTAQNIEKTKGELLGDMELTHQATIDIHQTESMADELKKLVYITDKATISEQNQASAISTRISTLESSEKDMKNLIHKAQENLDGILRGATRASTALESIIIDNGAIDEEDG